MLKIRTHIIFWVAVTALYTAVFGAVFESYALSFYFVSMLLPVVVATSYFFNFYLVPKFLLKKRYGRFSLYFVYMLIISLWLEMWVITGSYILIADLQYEYLSPVVTNIYVLAVFLYFVVFLKAFLLLIERVMANRGKAMPQSNVSEPSPDDFLTVRSDRQWAHIPFDEITCIESMGDYVRIITGNAKPVITNERINKLNEKLPEDFLRIHRSYIVNRRKVEYYSRTELQANGMKLPISRTYKDKVSRVLSNASIE